MEVKYLKPTVELIEILAENMRDSDREEVWVSHHETPLEALLGGWNNSEYSVVISVNNEPCVIIGVVKGTLLSGHGIIWMLGTTEALKYKKKFLTEVPKIMKEVFKVYSLVYNYVYVRNIVSIQWLEWIGFKFDPPEPFGVEGELFHRFHLEREDYV